MTKVRLLSATLATFLALSTVGAVAAQTPEPIERTPAMEEHAAEITALFPETFQGVSLLDNLQITVGQELIAELDPSDPEDARDIEQLYEMAATAGATLDDAAAGTTYAQLSDEAFAWVIVYQIHDADIGQVVPLFVAAFEEDIPDAIVEEGDVAGETVTTLRSGEDPEGGMFVFLPRGDVLWLVSAPPEYLEELVGSLPA